MKTIDCRGLACPAPVLKTRKTIETETLGKIAVLADNEAATYRKKKEYVNFAT